MAIKTSKIIYKGQKYNYKNKSQRQKQRLISDKE